MFYQGQTPLRAFTQTGTQGRQTELEGLADHVGLTEFGLRSRDGKVPGQGRRTRHGNGVKAFHREIITDSADMASRPSRVNGTAPFN